MFIASSLRQLSRRFLMLSPGVPQIADTPTSLSGYTEATHAAGRCRPHKNPADSTIGGTTRKPTIMDTTRVRPPRPPAPAKVKVLEVADRLFYTEGIHTVGVDKIIAQAHVTKATFYKHYRSKDLLIVAYVVGRDRQAREFVAELQVRLHDPAAVLRALADAIAVDASRDGFHGCPYINAAAQFSDPSHAVRVAVADNRAWYRQTLVDLLTQLKHPNPSDGADDLLLARDGALSGGNVGDPVAAGAALSRAFERVLAEAK